MSRETRLFLVLLTAIVAVAAVARLWGITDESAWNDEVLTLNHLNAPDLATFLRDAFHEDPVPVISPVYYLLQYGWACLFGPGLLTARMLSVALGLVAVVLVAWLGVILDSRRTGLLSAAFFSLSLVQVYYAQEVRFYALLNVEALLSCIGLLLALNSGSRKWWALHGVANMLLLFTHAFAPLLYLPQGACLAWHWHKRPHHLLAWGAAHVALLALFAVWARYVVGYDFAGQSTVFNDRPPGFADFSMSLLVFSGLRMSSDDPTQGMLGHLNLDIIVFPAILTLAVLPSRFLPRGHKLLLWLWLLLPLGALFAASLLWKPMFFYRYVLHAAIPLTLLAAMGARSTVKLKTRSAFVAVALAGLLWQNLLYPHPVRPDFQELAACVESIAPDTPVLALKPFVSRAAQYALGPGKHVQTYIGIADLKRGVAEALATSESAWVFFHRWDPVGQFEANMLEQGYQCELEPLGGLPPLMAGRVWR